MGVFIGLTGPIMSLILKIIERRVGSILFAFMIGL